MKDIEESLLDYVCFVNQLEKFIEDGGDINASCQSSGDSLLTVATLLQSEEAISLLLRQGADVNTTGKSDTRTALHWAVVRQHTEGVSLLLIAGADVNQKDQHGNTALIFAKRCTKTASNKAQESIIKLLKEHGAK